MPHDWDRFARLPTPSMKSRCTGPVSYGKVTRYQCIDCHRYFQRSSGLVYHRQHLDTCCDRRRPPIIGQSRNESEPTLHCAFCHTLIPCRNGSPDLRRLAHLRRSCPKRHLWTSLYVHQVPVLDFWLLGMSGRPSRLREFCKWMVHRPRWDVLAQRVVHDRPHKRQQQRQQDRWRRLVHFDHVFRGGQPWCTSGHSLTATAVKLLLASPTIEPEASPLAFPYPTCNYQSPFNDNGGSLVSISWNMLPSSWRTSCLVDQDFWTERLHQGTSERIAPCWCATVCTESDQQDSVKNKVMAIVNIGTRQMSIATDEKQAQLVLSRLHNEWLSVNHKLFESLCLVPTKESDIHDRLSIEILYTDTALDRLDIAHLQRSFARACETFVHCLLPSSSSSSSAAARIQETNTSSILISRCNRYALFQYVYGDVLWSVEMQYRFLSWWSWLDHYVVHLVGRSSPINVQIRVPYLIGALDSLCPFCIRLEGSQTVTSACRVTRFASTSSSPSRPMKPASSDRSQQRWRNTIDPLWCKWQTRRYLSTLKQSSPKTSGMRQYQCASLFALLQQYEVALCQTKTRHEWKLLCWDVHHDVASHAVVAITARLFCSRHYSTYILYLDLVYGMLHVVSSEDQTDDPASVHTLSITDIVNLKQQCRLV